MLKNVYFSLQKYIFHLTFELLFNQVDQYVKFTLYYETEKVQQYIGCLYVKLTLPDFFLFFYFD